MNKKRSRRPSYKSVNKNKKIFRCKSKMIPVFGSDTCEYFIKKIQTDSDNNCNNCKILFR